MTKSVYLLSTLSASQLYTTWVKGGADLPIAEKQILVAGGANVPDKRLITPLGVLTKVSAEDYEELKTNDVFNLHVANGYITVSGSKPADPDVAAASQSQQSPDAPLTEGDFAEGKAPSAGGGADVTDDKAQAQTRVTPRGGR